MASVFNLSEASAIGLHCCILLAENPDRKLNARELSRQLDVSYDHTVLVLQRLRQSGILESIQGPQGGFLLTNSPRKVRVLDIYEALEGPLVDKHCLFRQEKCTGGCALFGQLTGEISRIVREFFCNTTLDMLADQKFQAEQLEAYESVPM